MTRRILVLSSALCLAMLCWGGVAQPGEAKKGDGQGLLIKGELMAGDTVDKVLNQPAKVYPLKVKKGDGVLITLKGEGWDPELRVTDADGKQLGRNDDFEGLNPGLAVVAPESQEIKIIAGSHDGTVGAFTLEAQIIRGDEPGNLVKEDSVNAKDKQDPELMQPAKVYRMKLAKGKTYVIDMVAQDWDCEMRVLGPDGKEVGRNDDFRGVAQWSRVRLEAPEDGEYQIVAGSHGGETGRFVLLAREMKK